ncbi:hypothetical protein NMY22_g12819 [Coprinellus aureogranulatus]|nr:hypothetical protein NMY22_g12819 [Coprinellus aureogranulatus]
MVNGPRLRNRTPHVYSNNASRYYGSDHNQEFHQHGDIRNFTNIHYGGEQGKYQRALIKLESKISRGAAHDSAERGPHAPKCDEGTREAVQEDILSWIDRGIEPLMWMSGPAGAGKSAIAGSIADTCHEQGWLAGSFFFSDFAGQPDRYLKEYLFPTLAYHFIHLNIPRLREEILSAIDACPSVFDKRLDEQLRILILEPLRKIDQAAIKASTFKTIVVDGVDECKGDQRKAVDTEQGRRMSKEENHREIISCLVRASNDPSFPFRIIIVSRPERAIEQSFSSLSPRAFKHIFLDDKYNPTADIELYLRAKFDTIGRNSGIPDHWYLHISRRDVPRYLAQEASGQFIYAVTVVRYIQDGKDTPHEQLKRVLDWKGAKSSILKPFAALDALYAGILTGSPNPPLSVKWILSIVRYFRKDDPWYIQAMLESSPGETEVILGSLRALVGTTDKHGKPAFNFYHKSLIDFLGDQDRSGGLHLEETAVVQFFQERYSQVIKNRGPQGSLPPHRLNEFYRKYYQESCRYIDRNLQYDGSDVDWWMTPKDGVDVPLHLDNALQMVQPGDARAHTNIVGHVQGPNFPSEGPKGYPIATAHHRPPPMLSSQSPSAIETHTSLSSLDGIIETIDVRPPSASSGLDDTTRIGTEYAKAMHDYYAPAHQHDNNILSFRAGQVIRILNRDSSGWWDGELRGGRRGRFPSNYVCSDAVSLQDEEPRVPSEGDSTSSDNTRNGSMHSGSRKSNRSRTASQSSGKATRTDGNEDESGHRPIVDSMAQALALLQTAVSGKRPSHFQPCTVLIVSIVRAMLLATATLHKASPVLQEYPPLYAQRRRVLDRLTELVIYAKRASDESLPESELAAETEAMVSLAREVFTLLRRFLSIAEACGVELLKNPPQYGGVPSVQLVRSDDESIDTPIDTGRTPTQHQVPGRQPSNPQPLMRTNSRRELRSRLQSPLVQMHNGSHPADSFTNGRSTLQQQQQNSIGRAVGHGHRYNPSSSSISSVSSFSSQGSAVSLTPVPFPNGSSSASQVLEALKYTHDQYLSTIAAFIGHAHSHSRTSHASSTGQLYDLVREIVELVCKLLTIVEAVMQHPDVPGNRQGSLKAAKEGLFNVTSSLVESVRLFTMSLPTSLSEEDEKKILLQSATSALKAGADCTVTVKLCLTHTLGNRPFIINLPKSRDGEDLTIQPSTASPALQDREVSSEPPLSDKSGPVESRQLSVETTAKHVDHPSGLSTPPLTLPTPAPIEDCLPSSTSFAVKSDDGMAREGDVRLGDNGPTEGSAVERPIHLTPANTHEPRVVPSRLNDDLPPLPEEPLPVDPMTWVLSQDYSPDDIAYNTEGQLVGATMEVLVVKVTPPNSHVDPAFLAVFFLTFRIFSSPRDLVNAVIARYNLTPPPGITRSEDQLLWQQQKAMPVRLCVSQLMKTWLETHWCVGVDDVVLPLLRSFTTEGLAHSLPVHAQEILDLIKSREGASEMAGPEGDRSRDLRMVVRPSSAASPTAARKLPRPTITKTLLNALRRKDFSTIAITDFDALELARQLTIVECDLFCAIHPSEILASAQSSATTPVTVRAVSSLSAVITGWVADSVLDELDLKKRTLLVKFFIKVADVSNLPLAHREVLMACSQRCVSLQNYPTSNSILAALDSSTISRLRETWAGLPQKYKGKLQTLRTLADHSRNHHEYRSRLCNTTPPAVPSLWLYLTDVTLCCEDSSHRPSPRNPAKELINLDKYRKLAGIVQDMQRFQCRYNLEPVPEVQHYLTVVFEATRNHSDLQDLYRRSLLLEPAGIATGNIEQLFNWAAQPDQTAAS